MDMLTGSEFRRLIARKGGLWSPATIKNVFGDEASNWTRRKGFPASVWKAGQVKLYAGWEVWQWLVDTDQLYSARQMDEVMLEMKRSKFEA